MTELEILGKLVIAYIRDPKSRVPDTRSLIFEKYFRQEDKLIILKSSKVPEGRKVLLVSEATFQWLTVNFLMFDNFIPFYFYR